MNTYTETPVAPHLRYRELASRDTLDSPRPVALYTLDLLRAWSRLRAHLARPLTVTSGFRTPEHNRAVGGSPTSRHLSGQALDLTWPSYRRDLAAAFFAHDGSVCSNYADINQDLNLSLFLDFGFHGVGIAPTFIHLDVRPRADAALWLYTPRGLAGAGPASAHFRSLALTSVNESKGN